MADTRPILEFFGYPNVASFATEWRKLDDEDRAQIRQGIADGSLTY